MYMYSTQSLHLCFSCVFPELSLTPENLSTVLDSMNDGLWKEFSRYVNIPDSEQERIRSQYSSNRERKQAAINSLISGHPAPSWKLVAHAMYRMGILSGGDSCHRALDHLQLLFPTGTVLVLCVYFAWANQRSCPCCIHHTVNLAHDDHTELEGVHRTLTLRSTAVIRNQTCVTCARCWSLDLDPGSGTRLS